MTTRLLHTAFLTIAAISLTAVSLQHLNAAAIITGAACETNLSVCSSCVIEQGSVETNCHAYACTVGSFQTTACRKQSGGGEDCRTNRNSSTASEGNKCTGCQRWYCSGVNGGACGSCQCNVPDGEDMGALYTWWGCHFP